MSDVAKLQEELFAARQAYAQAQRRVSDLDGQLQDSKEENNTLKSQLRQHQTTESENRKNVQKVDELEGYLAGKEAENKRLKGRNQLLQEEVAELRSRFESKNLEASQAQGSAALHKSKLDEQAAQIMLLKRQLLEMEEEVRCFCRTTFYSQEAQAGSRRLISTGHMPDLFVWSAMLHVACLFCFNSCPYLLPMLLISLLFRRVSKRSRSKQN
jgi:predicted nuclease with TOPRIM domain